MADLQSHGTVVETGGHTKTQPATTFVRKLYQMATSEDSSVISFTSDGTAFEVKDPKRLELEILPRYFRHGRFQSLVRQLNFYNFKKISKERSMWVYRHELFQRDQPHLLDRLKRKTSGAAMRNKALAASRYMGRQDVGVSSRGSAQKKWSKIFDQNTNHYFYYNTETGHSQWEVPAEYATDRASETNAQDPKNSFSSSKGEDFDDDESGSGSGSSSSRSGKNFPINLESADSCCTSAPSETSSEVEGHSDHDKDEDEGRGEKGGPGKRMRAMAASTTAGGAGAGADGVGGEHAEGKDPQDTPLGSDEEDDGGGRINAAAAAPSQHRTKAIRPRRTARRTKKRQFHSFYLSDEGCGVEGDDVYGGDSGEEDIEEGGGEGPPRGTTTGHSSRTKRQRVHSALDESKDDQDHDHSICSDESERTGGVTGGMGMGMGQASGGRSSFSCSETSGEWGTSTYHSSHRLNHHSHHPMSAVGHCDEDGGGGDDGQSATSFEYEHGVVEEEDEEAEACGYGSPPPYPRHPRHHHLNHHHYDLDGSYGYDGSEAGTATEAATTVCLFEDGDGYGHGHRSRCASPAAPCALGLGLGGMGMGMGMEPAQLHLGSGSGVGGSRGGRGGASGIYGGSSVVPAGSTATAAASASALGAIRCEYSEQCTGFGCEGCLLFLERQDRMAMTGLAAGISGGSDAATTTVDGRGSSSVVIGGGAGNGSSVFPLHDMLFLGSSPSPAPAPAPATISPTSSVADLPTTSTLTVKSPTSSTATFTADYAGTSCAEEEKGEEGGSKSGEKEGNGSVSGLGSGSGSSVLNGIVMESVARYLQSVGDISNLLSRNGSSGSSGSTGALSETALLVNITKSLVDFLTSDTGSSISDDGKEALVRAFMDYSLVLDGYNAGYCGHATASPALARPRPSPKQAKGGAGKRGGAKAAAGRSPSSSSSSYTSTPSSSPPASPASLSSSSSNLVVRETVRYLQEVIDILRSSGGSISGGRGSGHGSCSSGSRGISTGGIGGVVGLESSLFEARCLVSNWLRFLLALMDKAEGIRQQQQQQQQQEKQGGKVETEGVVERPAEGGDMKQWRTGLVRVLSYPLLVG